MPVTTWPNLAALVEPLLGAPYAEYDCLKFMHRLLREGFDLDVPPEPGPIAAQFVEVWARGDARNPLMLVQPWDGVVLTIKGLVGDHVGLVLNETQFVHTRLKTGVVLEPLPRWHRRFLQVVRLRCLV